MLLNNKKKINAINNLTFACSIKKEISSVPCFSIKESRSPAGTRKKYGGI